MIKLLIWGFIGYIVYRYFQLKTQLKSGKTNPSRQQKFHHSAPEQKKDSPQDGDYIDYEEVK